MLRFHQCSYSFSVVLKIFNLFKIPRQLDVSITNSEMISSQSDTSIQDVVWYSEDKVQVSVQPLSSLFDTLLLLNGQPLESDDSWQLYRNDLL